MKSIMTALFVAAAGALLFWGARPMWDEIIKIRTEQADVESALSSLRDLQKLRDELLATYDSIPKDKLDRLNELLPSKKDISAMLVNFEKMTQERGMLMKKIEFSRDEGGVQPRTSIARRTSAAPEVSYAISVVGSYESLRSLLSALEKNLRIVDVDALNFAAGEKDPKLWEFAITAKSYYQPEQQTNE